ncbi:MAG: DUF5320 domain-containing protein [Fastidiosipilaceae bacterium]|jgi:hypothetical protein|nr:DUF5320 domain-containing protein [Clostridiaceae bacterium]
MPRRDGSGPMGAGAATGRGLGRCTDETPKFAGAGFGMGMGFGRGRGNPGRGMGMGFGRGRGMGRGHKFCRSDFRNQDSAQSDKDFLNEQKSFLQQRIDAIDAELENL